MMRPVSCASLLALALTLGACGGGDKAPATNTAPAAPAPASNTAPAPAATNTGTPAATGEGQLSTLKITNTSGWAIHELYMSPANENKWGQDQLQNQTIAVGGTFTLNQIPCDTYDIKVVDEDGDECIIEGEKICGVNATWALTKDELLGCQGFGEE